MTESEILSRALQVTMGVVLIDGLFHWVGTEPFETWTYFVVKMLLATGMAMWMYRTQGSPQLGTVIFFGLLFTLGLSIYYRSLEYFFGIKFGARVPDIVLGGKRIRYSRQPMKSTAIWGIVHMAAFALPALALG